MNEELPFIKQIQLTQSYYDGLKSMPSSLSRDLFDIGDIRQPKFSSVYDSTVQILVNIVQGGPDLTSWII